MPAVAKLPDSGQRIGRYQLIRRLAVGGMAEIFLARVPGVGIEGFEKLVVLKRILPQHALDPELLRMFLDEGRLSATLTHPHVTEVYDVGTDADAPFFAMEYVHGANLREIQRAEARREQGVPAAPAGPSASGPHAKGSSASGPRAGGPSGAGPRAGGSSASGPRAPMVGRSLSGPYATLAAPLPLASAIRIVASAAAGLHYAHERLGPGGEPLGIVHRDVSPSNVLVSYDGSVKVSDFGIAKWAFQRTRTQEGTLKGKFAYMSPEQCRGRPVDRRSDVFALGAILYEMTAGVPAFSGASDLDILNQIATGTATPPAWPEGGAPYPAALSAIVMRALAPDPGDRFPTMQALQVALESFARDAGLDLSTVALGTFMQGLFAEDIAAWHAAEREGKSLGDHLAAQPGTAAADPSERTATDAFAQTRPIAAAGGRWRRALATAGFVTLSAVAGGLVTKRLLKAEPQRAAVSGPAASAAPTPAPPERAATTAPAIRPIATGEPAASPRPIPPATAAKSRPRSRTRPTTTDSTPPRPTAESRLKTWDPDSPLPP
jgi:serine/threonine protein kinase